MEKHTPISAFLITCNEAEHIADVLAALQGFDEIIVVDSGSTDGTQDIVKASGATLYHQDWLGFAKQKQFAMSLCRNDWVFNVDGDEVVPLELATRIQTAVDSGSADAYRVNFEDIFWHKPMSPSSAKRSIVRVYHKQKIQFPTDRLVHENVKLVDGAIEKRIPGTITHYGYSTTHLLMNKQNTYSLLKAQEKHQKGKKPSLLKLVLIFPLYFIKTYLLKKMFLSGRRGLVHALIESMYAFLKEAKLHEQTWDEQQKNNKFKE